MSRERRRIAGLARCALLAFAGVLATVLVTSPAWGVDEYLVARQFQKVMPDGSRITMWGFARDADNDLTTDGRELPTVPGPRIMVPIGDETLTIHLRNDLPVMNRAADRSIAIAIPGGQPTPEAGGTEPAAGTHRRGREVPPCAGVISSSCIGSFSWAKLKPGTYLYLAESPWSVQTVMGLYGAVTKDAAPGLAYSTNASVDARYDREVLLFYSELDPTLNEMVTDPTRTPRTSSSMVGKYVAPKWLLVNGAPSSTDRAPRFAGRIGERLLFRFLNAGRKSRLPLVLGAYVSQIAETGEIYRAPRHPGSMIIAPGRTGDAMWVASSAGTFPVYDRSHMPSVGLPRTGRSSHSHSHDGHHATVAFPQEAGLVKLEVVPWKATITTTNLSYRLSDKATLSVPGPGVLAPGAAEPRVKLTAILVSDVAHGDLALNDDGSFSYVARPGFAGVDRFTYQARDGTSYSNVSTVEISASTASVPADTRD